eukprot:gnl/MRDRNA2_/MRDRNA2_133395_c0_seq1.p1 gnl/MRDRNA2_/MRDRNA2_133395_c0~~gnl/MRDRNA2_/MRDRNA2_133395_c0_seq1.p1  ORF type:complete len:483 (+),score=90.90 gnl/MRDRNA2_/MRDRNA2_133395_c0_seq1:211-1659(+)
MALLELILMTGLAIQSCEMAMFPAVLKVLEEYLPGATPATLGVVVMVQAICHCGLLPVWGYWADRVDRVLMLGNMSLMLAAVTMLMGFVTSLDMLVFVRSLAGVFSGTMHPIAQGMIASNVSAGSRGRYFGYTVFAPSIGGLVGMVYAGTMSHVEVFEHQGWRLAFVSLGLVSAIFGLALLALHTWSSDPMVKRLGEAPIQPGSANVDAWHDFKGLLRNKSFCLVILQGIFASTARSAMTYLIMVFQYMSFTDFQAASLAGMGDVGQAVGALIAGGMSDAIAAKLPMYGRISLGQVGTLGSILLVSGACVHAVNDPSTLDNLSFFTAAIFMVVLGFMAVVSYVGAIKPILAEIVPARMSASTLAYAAAIDGLVAAFIGAPLVGAVSENLFGYQNTDQTIPEMPAWQRKNNMLALSKSFLFVFEASTIMSFAIFSMLHFTFPQDSKEELSIPDISETDEGDAHEAEAEALLPKRASGTPAAAG